MKTIINNILNRAFDSFKRNFQVTKTKIILIVAFIIIFTGSDLVVKQIAYKTMKGKPDIVVIKEFWSYHYQTNDDIGFSALRWINKYFHVPKKISKNTFENRLIPELESHYEKLLLQQFYTLNSDSNYYEIKKDMDSYNTNLVLTLLSNAGYRTSKWLFLVFLQGMGALLIILFFFYTRELRYLLPLGIIIGGALGNVLDRIIRGYVIDYVMWNFKYIPISWLNPWPIFNLADVFTICGAVILIIVMMFFSDEKDQTAKVKS
jgi:lipoprotein signal peptidase